MPFLRKAHSSGSSCAGMPLTVLILAAGLSKVLAAYAAQGTNVNVCSTPGYCTVTESIASSGLGECKTIQCAETNCTRRRCLPMPIPCATLTSRIVSDAMFSIQVAAPAWSPASRALRGLPDASETLWAPSTTTTMPREPQQRLTPSIASVLTRPPRTQPFALTFCRRRRRRRYRPRHHHRRLHRPNHPRRLPNHLRRLRPRHPRRLRSRPPFP